MLASLLPGLREVRTPLTVGYLYLLLGWIWFADMVPRHRPKGDGLMARLFELEDIFGFGAAFGSLTFVAYVLGALLTISTERGLGRRVLDRSNRWIGVDTRQTMLQMDDVLDRATDAIEQKASGFSPREWKELEWETIGARRSSSADLRARLLVANQELYGEYDRLAAEAEFRLNLVLPLFALGITAGLQISPWYLLGTSLVLPLLAYQGIARRAEAQSVIFRAVLSSIIEHPMQTILGRFDGPPGSGASVTT